MDFFFVGPFYKRVCARCVCIDKPTTRSGSNWNVCAHLHTHIIGSTELGATDWCWHERRNGRIFGKLITRNDLHN